MRPSPSAQAAVPTNGRSLVTVRRPVSGTDGGNAAGVEAGAPEPAFVDLPDPTSAKGDNVTKARLTGPCFDGAPKVTDAMQGQLSDCFFAAALASLAWAQPDKLSRLVEQRADGSYAVKLWEWSGGNATRQKEIVIDDEVYVNANGSPRYGRGPRPKAGPKGTMIKWFPLIEKAYAMRETGSYQNLDTGGKPGVVMSNLLGTLYDWHDIAFTGPKIYALIAQYASERRPMVANTFGESRRALYTNTGVYAWHCYSVLGVEETNGQRYIKVRNPWGSRRGGDDGTGGIFLVELNEFCRLFERLTAGRI